MNTMEKKEPFDIFRFAVENKATLTVSAFVLFLVVSCPTKASVFFGILFCSFGEALRALSISEKTDEETLITTGIYGHVRNPEHLGNFFVGLGILVMGNIFIFVLGYVLIFLFIYPPKIESEEDILREKFGEAFEEYEINVPSLLPRFIPWQETEIKFNLNTIVLYKEHQVWFAIYVITIIMFLKT